MKAWPVLALALALAGCGRAPSQAAAAEPAKASATQAKAPTGQDLAEEAGASLIGKYAPPITLTTLDGQKIDLSKLYGKKPVYLKFWATWCVPCRLQMPHFENAERTMGRDIQVVAVNAGFNETQDAVRRYRETMGLTMPIVIDDGRLADALHLRVTPQHVVIGRDGRILYVGHLADARVDQALAQAIAEPPAASVEAGATPGRGRLQPPALKTLAGQALTLRDGARPTVIFFFSPWCESYLQSSRPAMAQACLKARDDVARLAPAQVGVRWIGAAAGLWATGQDLAQYQSQHPMPMPVALDETGGFFRSFRVADVPSFVVLDRAGRVIARTREASQAAALAGAGG
jgi:thiol-disulfide isomerase/thioredoxin